MQIDQSWSSISGAFLLICCLLGFLAGLGFGWVSEEFQRQHPSLQGWSPKDVAVTQQMIDVSGRHEKIVAETIQEGAN